LLAFLPTETRFRKTETSFGIHIPQFIEKIRHANLLTTRNCDTIRSPLIVSSLTSFARPDLLAALVRLEWKPKRLD
jgi:hypothetical protein